MALNSLVFILGLCVGSFLNVVIFRLPRGFLINLPSRSMCIQCKTRLRWHENLPLLGYILLRGRCRHCGARYGLRYFLVELMGGGLSLAVYLHYGLRFETLYYLLFVNALIAITFIDIDFKIIPDSLSIGGMVVGFLGSFLTTYLTWKNSLIGMALGVGLFWLMAWSYEKFSGREGLGFGDVKLLGMIGAFLGSGAVFFTIFASSILGSIVGISLMVLQKKTLKHALPFGPFLALAAFLYLFWGNYFMMTLFPFMES